MNAARCWCQRSLLTATTSGSGLYGGGVSRQPVVRRAFSVSAPSPSSSSSSESTSSSTSATATPPHSSSRTLALLKTQGDLYATVQLMGRRYLVTRNDVLTVPHLKDVSPGQTIELTRVLEVGSRDYTVRPTTTTTTMARQESVLRPVSAHTLDASLAPHRTGQEMAATTTAPARTKGLNKAGVPKDWQQYPDSLPYLSDNVVRASATVLEHTKGAMFEVEKFKKRKGYRRHLRFKLGWTKLRVNAIEVLS